MAGWFAGALTVALCCAVVGWWAGGDDRAASATGSPLWAARGAVVACVASLSVASVGADRRWVALVPTALVVWWWAERSARRRPVLARVAPLYGFRPVRASVPFWWADMAVRRWAGGELLWSGCDGDGRWVGEVMSRSGRRMLLWEPATDDRDRVVVPASAHLQDVAAVLEGFGAVPGR